MRDSNREEHNEYFREYMRRWHVKRKLDALALKGGKCQKCGYDACYAALDFHHRDPLQKEFEWAQLKTRSWVTIVAELEKCDLLCNRCHVEEHNDNQIAIDAVEWLEAHKRPSKRKVTGICEYCGKSFEKYTNTPGRFCNKDCYGHSKWKSRYPDDDEFIQIVDQTGRVQASKRFGVSHRAIAKRYNKIMGLKC